MMLLENGERETLGRMGFVRCKEDETEDWLPYRLTLTGDWYIEAGKYAPHGKWGMWARLGGHQFCHLMDVELEAGLTEMLSRVYSQFGELLQIANELGIQNSRRIASMTTRPTKEDVDFLKAHGFKLSMHSREDEARVTYVKNISLRWHINAWNFGDGKWCLQLMSGGEIRRASTLSNGARTLPEIYAELIRRINVASREMAEVCGILDSEMESEKEKESCVI